MCEKISRDQVHILCRCILSDGRRSSGRSCHHTACGATLWIWGGSDGCVSNKAEEKEKTRYILLSIRVHLSPGSSCGLCVSIFFMGCKVNKL